MLPCHLKGKRIMSSQGYPEDPGDTAHLKGVDELFKLLETSEEGLSAKEVEFRVETFGRNELMEAEKASPVKLLFEKFTEALILLLLASAAISFAIGETADAIGISVAVTLVVLLGFVQEYRSEKSVEALKKLATHRCRVIRSGGIKEVNADELVPGDIIVLNVGDRVPADLRLIESTDIQINESVLTGESESVRKNTLPIKEGKVLLAERKNMAYTGTIVTDGKGKGLVVATGERTELGKISQMIQTAETRRTPLQLKLDQLGKQLSIFALAVIVVIFVIGSMQGRGFFEMFTIGVSLAVAAIPEGLPIVVTVTLALGVKRMAKRRSIVRKLPAVEALGSTTVICTDKTGTLTQNEMTVTQIYTSEFIEVTGSGYEIDGEFRKNKKRIDPEKDAALFELLKVGLLCNNAHLDKTLVGQPTEGSLLSAAYKAGLKDIRKDLRRIEEIPFDSERKWMSISYETESGPTYYVKGAAERVLQRCSRYYGKEGVAKLSDAVRDEIMSAHDSMANSALRVIGLAYGSDLDALTFTGLVGIMDPPRKGVKKAIKTAKDSGVKVVMITGDSKETALAIAKELHIHDEGSIAFSGDDVHDLSVEELAEKIELVSVFYRVSPEHKMKIVNAYKLRGHVVAMTGDGVNDAPALKAADIGIAMGQSGTDVSKEASEMILVDDNFATIVAAIEEGKSIYYNIKNFLRFELTTSVAALTIVAFSTVLRLPLPLNPMQILWINIIMDGPPAQSLGVEPLDRDVMKRPPRNPDEPVITRSMIFNIVSASAIMVLVTLMIFFWELGKNAALDQKAMTMAFTVFVMFQMFNALNCRSEEKSVFSLGFFSNKYVIIAIAASVAMQLGVIYLPFLQYIFDTVALAPKELLLATVAGSTVFIFDEIRKLVR